MFNDEFPDVLKKGHNVIILSVGNGVPKDVDSEKTTVKLWKKVEDLYTKKSMTKRLATKKKLHTYKWNMRHQSQITLML